MVECAVSLENKLIIFVFCEPFNFIRHFFLFHLAAIAFNNKGKSKYRTEFRRMNRAINVIRSDWMRMDWMRVNTLAAADTRMLKYSLPATPKTYRAPPSQSDRIWRRQQQAGTFCEYNSRDRRCAILRFLRIHFVLRLWPTEQFTLRCWCDWTTSFISSWFDHLHFVRAGMCELCIEYVRSCQYMWRWWQGDVLSSNTTHFHPEPRELLFVCFFCLAGNCLVPVNTRSNRQIQLNPFERSISLDNLCDVSVQYMSASLLQQPNHEAKSWHFENEIFQRYAKRFFEANVAAEKKALTHISHYAANGLSACSHHRPHTIGWVKKWHSANFLVQSFGKSVSE